MREKEREGVRETPGGREGGRGRETDGGEGGKGRSFMWQYFLTI